VTRSPVARLAQLALRVALVVAAFAPFVIPLLPEGLIRSLLDLAYWPACHRLPERTLALGGVLMPLCSRCAGVFAGLGVAALVPRLPLSLRAHGVATGAATLVMLVDVVTQDLALRPLWHTTRLATGLAVGVLLGSSLFTALAPWLEDEPARRREAEPRAPTR
jgi:uncharacterized membrane protein